MRAAAQFIVARQAFGELAVAGVVFSFSTSDSVQIDFCVADGCSAISKDSTTPSPAFLQVFVWFALLHIAHIVIPAGTEALRLQSSSRTVGFACLGAS